MPKPIRSAKVELPLSDDAEIKEVVQQFEGQTLLYANWTHRAHLAVAVCYLRQLSFEEALTRLREKINAYNQECGDPDGYNETVTATFLKKIDAEAKTGESLSVADELAALTESCTLDWLYRYYSRELIWSEAAKVEWLPPDVAEFDFGS